MAERSPSQGVRLQVAGAQSSDVGKSTARLNRNALQTLGIREGEIIEIVGKRTTAAIALPPYPVDEGLNVIRLDGLQRANAGVSMGDYVEVRRAEARPARRIVLAPAQKNLRLSGSGEALRRTLYQRPLVAGDDKIESLAPQRGGGLGEPAVTERVVNTLLAEMDGLEELQGVVVIEATNRPTLIDPALLRPGRFDELVYVPVPDEVARLRILQIHTAPMPLAADVDLKDLASRTQGYTGADLENLVRRAGLHALRENLDAADVPMRLFEVALQETRPSVTADMEREYQEMAARLKQESVRFPRIGFQAAWNGPDLQEQATPAPGAGSAS